MPPTAMSAADEHVHSGATTANEPPSYSQFEDVKTLPFRESTNSNAPQLPPIQTLSSLDKAIIDARHKTLPSISSVTGSVADSIDIDAPPPSSTVASSVTGDSMLSDAFSEEENHWPSLNPLTAYYTPGHVQSADSPLRMDVDSASGSPHPRGSGGRSDSVSLDDPDVRLAAEALGDLRADFINSPSRSTIAPTPSHNLSSEPLFSLLTTSHPLLAKTIEGTTSAYNTSKNFSPRFKSSAEYVEGYLAPISNTIGSVSRVTGVEGGVRWFLGGGRRRHQHQHPSESDSSKTGFYKRRRIELRRGRATNGVATTSEALPLSGTTTPKDNAPATPLRSQSTARHSSGDASPISSERRLSMSTVETLPAYDDIRSPAYTEESVSINGSMNMDAESEAGEDGEGNEVQGESGTGWPSRLIMSTSGLSIAMSEESLRSLKYCLNWLRWANGRVDKVIVSLKTAVDTYDSAHGEADSGTSEDVASTIGNTSTGGVSADAAAAKDRRELEAHIASLRGDLLQTLRGAVDTVSKYAGGALPDNARVLVRKHLTSLPQRFRYANQGVSGSTTPTEGHSSLSDKDVREGAQRVLVLAKEGLDMMSQVSGVLDGTIVSAEEWCERLGRKKRPASQSFEGPVEEEDDPMTPQALPPTEANGDIIMQ